GEVAGEEASDDPDRGRDRDAQEGGAQRQATAVHRPAEDVAAELICAERMSPVRSNEFRAGQDLGRFEGRDPTADGVETDDDDAEKDERGNAGGPVAGESPQEIAQPAGDSRLPKDGLLDGEGASFDRGCHRTAPPAPTNSECE